MEKNIYKISVIVPVYNTQEYIGECIESIINQSYRNIQVLLIDDGSTDESLKICKKYESLDDRINVIHQENGGAAKARNRGIKEAKGDYIVFVDSDDYWDDYDSIKMMVNNLIESNADILNFGCKKYIEESKNIEKYRNDFNRKYIDYNSKKKSLKYLCENNLFTSSPCNKIIKRNILIDNDLMFIEGITSEDIDWNARLIIFSNKFDVLENNIYVYRQRKESTSRNVSQKSIEQLLKNINKCLDYINIYNLKETDFFEEYMTYVAYQYMTLLVIVNSSNIKLEKSFLKKVKEYRYLLNYDINYRVKVFKKINKYLGFNILNKFIKIYIKIKNNI